MVLNNYVRNTNLNSHLKLSAEMCNVSRSRFNLQIEQNYFVIEGLVFELWCGLRPLQVLSLPSETKLCIAVYIAP